jgi:hypothetical protein
MKSLGDGAQPLSRWWTNALSGLMGRRRDSPGSRALQELDRVRSLGWHRNGRVDEFYASSTDALRRFAHDLDPNWNTGLTSTELLRGLQERWGDGRVKSIVSPIQTAERAKFGADRPTPDQAEADWVAIREWIRKTSES